jgi:hypothetical protein
MNYCGKYSTKREKRLFAKLERAMEDFACNRAQIVRLGRSIMSMRQSRQYSGFAMPKALRIRPRARSHSRAYRSPARSRRVTVDSGGDDGSGQGDPYSDPPKPSRLVVFPAQKKYSFPMPWPRHGCCCVASERGRSA